MSKPIEEIDDVRNMLCLQAEAYGMLGLNILAFLQVRYLHIVISNANANADSV